MQHPSGQHHRDHDLGLQQQGRQPRRHARGQRQVQEPELPQRHQQPYGDDHAPARSRARDQQDRWEQHDAEAQDEQQQRRDVLQTPVDDDEVEAPDGGDQGGEQAVTSVHQVEGASCPP